MDNYFDPENDNPIGSMRVAAFVFLLTCLAAILAVVGVIVFAVKAHAAPNPLAFVTTATQNVSEDSPEFNCWISGNGVCGDTLAYVEATDSHGRGAILSAASDGKVYVSWQDGTVTEAVEWQRHAGWETCVATAEGTDASLFACDEGFTYPGDHFSMAG